MNEGSCGEAVSLVIINFAFQIVMGALDQKDNMEVKDYASRKGARAYM